jgi:hypothetical protein
MTAPNDEQSAVRQKGVPTTKERGPSVERELEIG